MLRSVEHEAYFNIYENHLRYIFSSQHHFHHFRLCYGQNEKKKANKKLPDIKGLLYTAGSSHISSE